MEMIILTKILLLLSMALELEAYPSGAPLSSCMTMMPSHESSSAQLSESTIRVSLLGYDCYTAGKSINMTISGGSFKGFLVKTKQVSETAGYLGSFLAQWDQAKVLNCDQQNPSLTHTNGNVKSSVVFTWIVPTIAPDEIIFRLTAVKSYSIFWAQVDTKISKCKQAATTSTKFEETSRLIKSSLYTTTSHLQTTSRYYTITSLTFTMQLFNPTNTLDINKQLSSDINTNTSTTTSVSTSTTRLSKPATTTAIVSLPSNTKASTTTLSFFTTTTLSFFTTTSYLVKSFANNFSPPTEAVFSSATKSSIYTSSQPIRLTTSINTRSTTVGSTTVVPIVSSTATSVKSSTRYLVATTFSETANYSAHTLYSSYPSSNLIKDPTTSTTIIPIFTATSTTIASAKNNVTTNPPNFSSSISYLSSLNKPENLSSTIKSATDFKITTTVIGTIKSISVAASDKTQNLLNSSFQVITATTSMASQVTMTTVKDTIGSNSTLVSSNWSATDTISQPSITAAATDDKMPLFNKSTTKISKSSNADRLQSFHLITFCITIMLIY